MTAEAGPSVIQVRTQDVIPANIGALVLTALEKHKDALDRGALLSIQGQTSRVWLLNTRSGKEACSGDAPAW